MNKHPEGLPFAPEGAGWTTNPAIHLSGDRVRLLSENNVVAVQRNNPTTWSEAFASLPAPVRARNGRLTGLTEEERRRLATLAVLIDKGVVHERSVRH